MDLDLRLEWIKLDLLIIAAIFSAQQLNFNYHPQYVALSVAFILFPLVLLFIFMTPAFEGEDGFETFDLRPPMLDVIIACHIMAILSIVLSYSGYPEYHDPFWQAVNMGFATGFVFLCFGLGRYWELKGYDRDLAKFVVVSFTLLEFLLIIFMGGMYFFNVVA